MKKTRFLTLIHKNGSDVAEYVNGYTDHAYNYYKDKYGHWYAILPDNGMAICTAYRLKDAHQAADAIECPGNCETCGACWSLAKRGISVFFKKH